MMRRTGDFFHEIYSEQMLKEAARLTCNGRKDKREVAAYRADEKANLETMAYLIKEHAYVTSRYRFCKKLEHGKVRDIADLPLFPDRIIRRAYAEKVIPIIDRTLIDQTFASRPGKGTHAALATAQKYLRKYPKLVYCLSLDVHHCYENIDTDILESKLEGIIKDPDVLKGLFYFIDSYPRPGISIGDCLSSAFCNLYFSEFDHYVKEQLKGHAYIRYADNVFLFGNSKKWLLQMKAKMEAFIETLNVSFKPNWTISDLRREGVDFLGYRLYKDYVLLRDSTKIRMKRKMRELDKKLECGYIPTASDMGSISSYHGCLKWCDGYRLEQKCLAPTRARARARIYEANASVSNN